MSPIVTTMSAPAGRGRRVKAPGASAVQPFFEDTFAGTQKNNANGVTWGSVSGDVSVVSFDSRNALRFRYPVRSTGLDGPNTEQRLAFGRELTHLCVEYDLHVPSNFKHRATGAGGTFANNKFFMMWRDPYSDNARGTWRVGFEFPRTSDTESYIRGIASRRNLNSWTDSNSTGDFAPTGQFAKLISSTGPITIGAWNQIRIEVKRASSATGTDGIQRLWVNGVKLYEITTAKFWNFETGTTPTDCFLDSCYFMGYPNSGYDDQTDFHVSNPKFYDQNPGWI